MFKSAAGATNDLNVSSKNDRQFVFAAPSLSDVGSGRFLLVILLGSDEP